jgi:hypothetical protein
MKLLIELFDTRVIIFNVEPVVGLNPSRSTSPPTLEDLPAPTRSRA